ncbi:Chloride channel protein [Labilithrix luteola]|uniref:Chloride channel protein n=1 Tax=Labilithrix luteola TaxID=1391654 RepID=A0A0K1QFF7_9BACT|nr:chloride channel protein [Labilithrix luteola]AKV04511.1 Chloride channel protein [Labilithrix luteola]
MSEEPPRTSEPARVSERASGRISTLPQPALQRLTKLIERGFASRTPLTLQLLGRLLLHAAAVGAAVGFVSLLFVEGLELAQVVVLEHLAGYVPLRAAGEQAFPGGNAVTFKPWLLWIIPGIGALLAGLVTKLAPETRGGGADAIIEAFHAKAGAVRTRVPFVKVLASIFTLGSGGSGGREGPTMQIGGSIGAIVGRYLRVTDRERRILLVAGTAAGMAAVFRTPLGAAILAVEVLHKNDFESDALVPSVLASVVSYSVFISFFGESTLFAHAPKYPFIPVHLPLYAVMALVVCAAATLFVWTLDLVRRWTSKLPWPPWVRPAVGGLALGIVATPIIYLLGSHLGEGQGLGILGGGYGAAQVAITGASWLPEGWKAVEVLLVLGILKIVATSLTVGSGGSAGDFGPSMVLGGIFGGAFGRAAQLLLHDPRIDPGAFALVGMGTFYGGLAHVPIGSLVMTCELAGSYDLLVPLMLAEGIAFIALRNRSLYHAQVETKRESPAHRDELIFDLLKDIRVDEVMIRDRPFTTFQRSSPASQVVEAVAAADWQDAFPVLAADGTLVGVVTAEILRTMASDPDLRSFTLADDLMASPVAVRETEDLHHALDLLLASGMREVVVTNASGRVVGILDQTEITAAYLAATSERKA